MQRRSRQSTFPSRNSRPAANRPLAAGERGVAFLILMMIITMLLIALTVSLPDVITQGQRDKEEELLFRGDQYARAILLYHRQFNKYPQTVDDLIKKTNGYRFLRHAFRDPMTRSGKWRFIHANAAGVIFDSKTLTPPKPKKPMEGDNSSGDQNGSQSGSDSNTPGQGQDSAGAGGQSPGSASPTSAPQQGGSTGDNDVKGAFIVGVASTSTNKSIRIWNNKDRYDLWEFLGVATAAGPATQSPGGAPGGTTQPGNPNSPNSQ